MEDTLGTHDRNSGDIGAARPPSRRPPYELIVILVAVIIYGTSLISPPSLMDDVDAVQARIGVNMLESGDWVTARLNGVRYLEKPPLKYWMITLSYLIFGVHDWAARIPVALSVILLSWLTFRIGRWAMSELTGFYAGLIIPCCVGIWLFTRVQISDVILTLTITLAMWGFLRCMDEAESRPRLWAGIMAGAIGAGLLIKGLIAAVLPGGAIFFYLLLTRQLFSLESWKRLRPLSGIGIILAVAAPWHILAALRNPPFVDFTMESGPGHYRGFFWFYFLNEHVFRFLNMRYPRDYNTVPRALFWLSHLLWLFPWSAFMAGVFKVSYKPVDRAGRLRFLCLCWAGFLMAFFSLSTTQEYYSMPSYPALALLLASGLVMGGASVRIGAKALAVLCLMIGLVLTTVFVAVFHMPTPGDISAALSTNTELYTLSLGHMADLTLESFAYLRFPVLLAALAFLIGAFGAWRWDGTKRALALVAMMILFFNAARAALIAFDPYLSSRPLAEALLAAPDGKLIVDNQYYAFSSVFFYARTDALLLNGRVNNLEYGSYAPGAPDVFIDDAEFADLWQNAGRWYLCVEAPQLGRIEKLAGKDRLHIVKSAGGKLLLTNHEP